MIMVMMRSKAITLQLWIFSILLFIAPSLFGQAYEPYYLHENCNNDNKATSEELKGIDNLLQNLKPNTSFPYYATASNESPSLHALLQCRRDLAPGDCDTCLKNASTNLQKNCSQQVGGMIWYDGCFLRYDNQNFFSILDTGYYYDYFSPNYANDLAFEDKSKELIPALVCAAKGNNGFAMGSMDYNSTNKIYGLVQCNQDMTMDNCLECLKVASTKILGFCDDPYNYKDCEKRVGRRSIMENCYIQYEQTKFYIATAKGLITDFTKCGKGSSNKIIYYILGGVGGLLFLVFIFFIAKHRKKSSHSYLPSHFAQKDKNGSTNTQGQLPSPEMEIFSWDAMVAATNNFENKLGEGGFGIVYLGKLVNGRQVAVKKLLVKSDRERKEFLNEVGLVAKLQHRNLASLVGCCAEGQERLLVYEYMPNSSLDTVLFDPSKKNRLNWKTRFELIMGIARGLLYLHEDSAYHVIHRDIKAANILLDDQFRPKIADFGTAHLFSIEATLVATRVAGTLGYISPEYLMHGLLSTKVDIYSYGILVLEIISGRRNNDPTLPLAEAGLGLANWASTLQKEGRCLELVDPDLCESLPQEFVLRCIDVALLCTESMSSKRPSISSVLTMLSSSSVTLPIINSHSSSCSSSTKQTLPLLGSVNEVTITEVSGR